MRKFLLEKTPLQLTNCERSCVKETSIREFPNLCLWPMPTAFIENGFSKQYVCKNDTFDEKGRLIVYRSDTISCELEKITLELYQKYQPAVYKFEDSKTQQYSK